MNPPDLRKPAGLKLSFYRCRTSLHDRTPPKLMSESKSSNLNPTAASIFYNKRKIEITPDTTAEIFKNFICR